MTKASIIAIALAATVTAGTAAQAAPDLPILVDKHYELKNPSGPVEAAKGPEYRVMPSAEIDRFKDMPKPNEGIIGGGVLH